MRNVLRVVAICIVFFATVAAYAGITYSVTTRTDHDGETFTTRVRAQVDGQNARIDILEGGPQPYAAGSYLLTRDSGKTFVIVNPKTRTYSSLTPEETLGDNVPHNDSAAKLTTSKPEVTRLALEDSSPMFGYATRHSRYRTTYIVTVKLVDSFTSHVTREDEIWSTLALHAPGATSPALSVGSQIGIDPLVEEAAQLGFPLKRITTTNSESLDGTTEKVVTSMELTDIMEGAVDADTFKLPVGFVKVKLQSTD